VIVVIVIATVAGVAVATRTPGTAAPGGPPVTPASFVSAPTAESSAWYCGGQTTASGAIAVGTLVLTNTTGRDVLGTISSITDTGVQLSTGVTVPPHAQLVPDLPAPSSGSWLAQSVDLSAGGTEVTEVVHGPNGWSETPCQSRTAQNWYFPSGATTTGDGLYISLFNPTSTADVVDLSFVVPGGVDQPINFQGLVLQPGQVQVEDVGAFVQNQSTVSTIVNTRTGRVIADEVEAFTGFDTGLSVLGGAAQAEGEWVVPLSEEAPGSYSDLDIFNPGSTTEHVTVAVHLSSGPVAPITQAVAPLTTWVLATYAQTRIPSADPYSAEVRATGGNGVVVARVVAASPLATAPQAGLQNGVSGLTATWPSRVWLVPSPGSTAMPAYTSALPEHLALANPTGSSVHFVVLTMTPTGTRQVDAGTVGAHSNVALGGKNLFTAGLYPLVVRGTGPLAVSEDVGPSGAIGAVTMPGVPIDSGR
jgi:hypothetical protein